MKTTRRQELRTNELSQQIDQAGEYVKQNAAIFTLVLVIAAALVIGGFWYKNRQNTIEADAWGKLAAPVENEDAMTVIDRYQAVADEHISDAVTTTALLRVGDFALAEIANPTPASEDGSQPGSDVAELTAKARAAFQKVIASASDDLTAFGHALMAMGIIEENAGQFDKARQWYDRLAKEKRLANTPFKAEAEYRLAGLDSWSQEVVFPPPPPMEPGPPTPLGLDTPFDLSPTTPGTTIQRLEPDDTAIPPTDKPNESIETTPVSVEPETPADPPAPAPVEPPAASPPATETPKPAPTTQPAGN